MINTETTVTTKQPIAELYSKRFYQAYNGQFAGDPLSKEIVRQTKKYIKGNVLDVGAGSGAMMECLKVVRGVTMVKGIDLAPTKDSIIECSSDDMPFEDNKFDTIMWNAMIEHLADAVLQGTLKEIYRVMNFNAHVIITTAYKENLSSNDVECPYCKQHFHRWGHVRSYDAGVMLAQISPLFEVVRLYHTSLGFLNAHPKLRYIQPLLNAAGFLKGDEYLICIAKKSNEDYTDIDNRKSICYGEPNLDRINEDRRGT